MGSNLYSASYVLKMNTLKVKIIIFFTNYLDVTENLREPLKNRLNPLIYKEHEELNFSLKLYNIIIK
jgi:hypothetical protein